jgi:sulfur-oxidizing protein SoxZ
MARTLINVPKTARQGDVIEVRTLIAHPMETGYRTGDAGTILPRNLIRRFTCSYDGEEVFAAQLFPAVSANPLISFFTVATVSGTLTFTWEGDNGFTQTETASITVT